MGVFLDKTIKEVVDELNVRYFLPDIQREYVWLKKADEKKIEQLFDSILRGYPIGSFLFWKLQKEDIAKSDEQDSDKLNFQLYQFITNYDERKPHNEKIRIEQIRRDDLYIVLDGQQRLTSLYIGLKGTRMLKKKWAKNDNPNAYEERRLYLNLKRQPDMDNLEDNYEFEFHAKKPENDKKHWWFKVGDILELKSVVNYTREHNLGDEESELLETLNKAFHDKQLISFFEETEKNLNKVLNIFIRVDSGGVKLSYSDLLMSILTASFSSDIREKMNELVDTLKDKGFPNVGKDQVLKTCLLLIGKDTTFELKNFNKKNIKEIEDNWEKITDSIYNAAELLKSFGYAGYLGSAYILSSLAYFYFLNSKMDKNDEQQALKFVRNAQITSYFTPSTDTKLNNIANSMKDAQTFESFNHNLAKHQTCPLKITNDAIEEMMCSSSHALVFPILQILYPNLNYKTTTFHIDHIYPKSKFKKIKNWIKISMSVGIIYSTSSF
ncbi:ancestral polypeptide [Helicobacter pylori NY40]|uniref:Ancestral polypeptide n=1 Tax=Helicobacter pylori NY40 TaxID=1426844 RepID=A0A060PWE1_HELPX|nr:ancestral polypeptide [Helicobacter pylori NY40]